MKTMHYSAHDTHTGYAPAAGENLYEGAPAGLPKLKASVAVAGRPHILSRRAARWSRRAAH